MPVLTRSTFADAGSTEPSGITTLMSQDWFIPFLVHHLDSDDLLRFAGICRATRVLRLTPALPLEEEGRTWNNPPSRYFPHVWQPIPHLEGLKLNSVHVRCRWKDQGWGNRKGMLSVVRAGGQAPNDYCKWGPDVMCGKEPAPHDFQRLSLYYRSPADGERFDLCARAGGGGGHSLSVDKLVVRAIALVDSPEAEAAFARHFPGGM